MSERPIYHTYAPIYDATGQERFGAYLARLTLGWLEARAALPRTALDLACGTGGAALALAAAGITVIGLDQSPAMLRIARGRARAAGLPLEYIEGDMRDLHVEQLTPRPALVTCFGDSLNYLIEDSDLHDVFAGVARVLDPGGHLAFDVNTAAAFQHWDERDLVIYDSADCLVYNRLEFSAASNLGTGRIVWFVRGDDHRWWRGEETHVERAWRDEDIRAALALCGFTLVARLDAAGNPVAADAALPERLLYLARR